MYKSAITVYIVCLFCYIIFSRTPDYFESDFANGTVSTADFVVKSHHPQLIIDYKVGAEAFQYKTEMWFIKQYHKGDKVEIIYNSSTPSEASIYAFIGYWITWHELFASIFFFVVFFAAAIFITGKNNTNDLPVNDEPRKRKYKD